MVPAIGILRTPRDAEDAIQILRRGERVPGARSRRPAVASTGMALRDRAQRLPTPVAGLWLLLLTGGWAPRTPSTGAGCRGPHWSRDRMRAVEALSGWSSARPSRSGSYEAFPTGS